MSKSPSTNPPVRLRSLAVQPQTAARYQSAYDVFVKFIRVRFGTTVDRLIQEESLDVCFEMFCDACYNVFEGRRRQLCVNALQGVLWVHGHQLKSLFPCSRRALSAWNKVAPSRSALPLPQEWVDLVAVCGLFGGYGILSFGFVIAFEGYLRVGELCRLRGSDILVDGLVRSGSTGCGLRIRVAKTGRNQFARIKDPHVITILRFLKGSTDAESLVFHGATPRLFNALLKLLCAQLGLSQPFTMHSLRHGRASKGHLDGELPEHVRLEGRWASSKSMETYLQAAAALLQTLQCPPVLRSLLPLGPVFREHLVLMYQKLTTLNE